MPRNGAPIPRPVPGAPPRPAIPEVERWTLGNGLRVAAVPHRTLPQVALRLIVPAGAAAEPPEAAGTAALVGALLTEGTERMSALALNERLDRLGASLDAHVGHDFAEVEMFLLSDTLREGLLLLADAVAAPVFPEVETERVRAETLEALEARLDEPANVADDAAAHQVFGSEHPYGRLAFGTEPGVAGVSRAELRAFHAAHYLPGGSVLVVAGDFDLRMLRESLEAAFDGWRGDAARARVSPPASPPGAGRRFDLAWPDAAQAEIRVAGIGLERGSPEWIPAAVANFILGGSTITGRLGANLREDRGWTYGVRSAFSGGAAGGAWEAATAVDVEVTNAALGEMLHEMRRMSEEPVPAGELRRAKDALILSLPRAFESPARIVGRVSTIEAFGLTPDYWSRFPAAVERVTAEEVLRVSRAYFDPDRLVSVVVGESSRIS